MARSRIREFKLPLSAIFGGSSLLGLLICIGLVAAGLSIELNLAIVALLLGVIIPLGLEVRSVTTRRRRVLILDYRIHQFGHAVARGANSVFMEHERDWDVDIVIPNPDEQLDAIPWQVQQLQLAQLEDVDGLIVVPAGDDESLWFALAATIKNGAFVTVVDTKPPNRIFRDIGIEPPRFVSSRYSETGVLIGDYIADWLAGGEKRQCVLWTGPEGSWPGEERSRNVLYEIARRNLVDQTELYPIDSWAAERKRCVETLAMVEAFDGETAIYCADDENAFALHMYCLTESPHLRKKMLIVGCNGTPDDWGNVLALDMHAVDATVDILAEELGVRAAVLFIKERLGKLEASERTVFIEPKLKTRESRKQDWLDGLAQHPGENKPMAVSENDGSANPLLLIREPSEPTEAAEGVADN